MSSALVLGYFWELFLVFFLCLSQAVLVGFIISCYSCDFDVGYTGSLCSGVISFVFCVSCN